LACFSPRRPEGAEVENQTLGLFARVSACTAPFAAMRVKNILGSQLGPGMKILDIGAGPGTILLNLKKAFPATQFVGVDISPAMIRTAGEYSRKTALPVGLCVADGQCLPIGENAVDGVICLFAMHHMDHPEMLLEEIDRAIKPGGFLLLIDFRRDMPAWMFGLINAFWNLFFCLSKGRTGFADSARSAWRPDEIETAMKKQKIERFRVYTNRMELWVIT
jgi:ubiquinone/menaquinone biosynthesis C-methylase UbiE